MYFQMIRITQDVQLAIRSYDHRASTIGTRRRYLSHENCILYCYMHDCGCITLINHTIWQLHEDSSNRLIINNVQ